MLILQNRKQLCKSHCLLTLKCQKLKNKSNKTWEAGIFPDMVPTVAALTILSKFQNDVKTSENKGYYLLS